LKGKDKTEFDSQPFSQTVPGGIVKSFQYCSAIKEHYSKDYPKT
jgi:hypothetical protein